MQNDRNDNGAAERDLPDMNICRVKAITDSLAYCLVDPPWKCPYAVSFGDRYLCRNADVLARLRLHA